MSYWPSGGDPPATGRTEDGSVPIARLAGRELLGVSLFFSILTVILAAPLSIHPGSTVFGLNPDTRLYIWTLSWDVHALLRHPWSVFDANIFFPERHTLAYSENLLGSAILAAPVLLATGNPVLAMNLVALAACVLSGLGGYVLARQVGTSAFGGIAAGVIFAFAPPRFFRIGQAHLASVQWIPFALAFFHAYGRSRRRRELLAAAAFFTLQSLTSGHAGLFLALTIGGQAVFLRVSHRLPPLTRVLRDLGWVGALVLAPSAMCLVPYLEVARGVGLHRTLDQTYRWAPNAVSFLAAPTHVQQVLVSLVPGLSGTVQQAKAALFPGWLTLFLAAAALPRGAGRKGAQLAGVGSRWHRAWSAVRRRLDTRTGVEKAFYLVLAVVSFWACLGPSFGLYAALYRLVPGFDFIRVPSRFMVLTLLALAVLAAYGLDRLLLGARGWRRAAAGAGAVALLIAELSAFPLTVEPYAPEAPEIDRILAARAKPFVVVEMPVVDPSETGLSAEVSSRYMIHSMLHWQPLVNGYSGFVSPRQARLEHVLTAFPDERSLTALERLRVTYVVLHRDFYDKLSWRRTIKAVAAFPERLHLEATTNDGQLYSLAGRSS